MSRTETQTTLRSDAPAPAPATRRSTLHRLAAALGTLYDEHEARQIALLLLAERSGVEPAALLADATATLAPPLVARLDADLKELAAGRPLQYVVGAADFCGMRLSVREGVLIPRPETEELVQWIAATPPRPRRLLDVGCGSGCIALALKRLLPDTEICGADLSPRAIETARANAEALGLQVVFRRADALKEEASAAAGGREAPSLAGAFGGGFDAIVSNPPYIPVAERQAMHRNVTEYEPAEALFVPDDDPLLFYRAIAHAARKLLLPGGRLWFELHENLVEETRALLTAEGYAECRIRRDFLDKPRMLCARLDR